MLASKLVLFEELNSLKVKDSDIAKAKKFLFLVSNFLLQKLRFVEFSYFGCFLKIIMYLLHILRQLWQHRWHKHSLNVISSLKQTGGYTLFSHNLLI